MDIVPCLDCHQHVITVFTTVKHIYAVKVKIHNLNLAVILPNIIPKHIHIVAPVPVHQHQLLSIQILNGQTVFTGKTMVDGNRTTDRLPGNFKTRTVSQIQHCVIKNPRDHINMLSKVLQNLSGILRCIFIGNKLKFDFRAKLMNLRPKFH